MSNTLPAVKPDAATTTATTPNRVVTDSIAKPLTAGDTTTNFARPINVMVDIETWGTSPGSAIASIGAILFSTDGRMAANFYCTVDLTSCIDVGLSMDPATVLWWMERTDEARRELIDPGRRTIKQALTDLANWLQHESQRHSVRMEDLQMWSNGAAFDLVLLEQAYFLCRIKMPWKYWQQNCYRTLAKQHPQLKLNRHGTHHNALDDARSQAMHLCDILAATLHLDLAADERWSETIP